MAGHILFAIFCFHYLFLPCSRRLKVSGQALGVKAVTTTNDTDNDTMGLYRKSHSGPDPPRKTERL